MDSKAVYDHVLSRVEEDLKHYGYKRSGKGRLFYRYSAYGKVGCVFEMQRSAYNTTDSQSFTFNVGCVALYELSGYYKAKLTAEPLKLILKSPSAERLGGISRGYDYWWEFSDKILESFPIEEYYDRFLHADIIKCAGYLDDLSRKKERIYLGE